MKIPLKAKCSSCKKEQYIFLHALDTSFNSHCKCGEDLSGYLDTNFTLGFKILARSLYELKEMEDYSMCIVFAASAVDCELSSLHKKWHDIDALLKGREISKKELDTLLLGYKNIFKKLKETTKLMYPKGFTKYVKTSKQWKKTIVQGFPSLKLNNLISDIHKYLFRPRNIILHSNDMVFSEKDALRSYNIANLSLLVFQDIDKYKRAKVK